MPFMVRYDEAGFIAVTYDGDLDYSGAKKLVSHIILCAKEHDCFHILADYRNAILLLPVVVLYEMPKLIFEETDMAGVSVYRLKRAIVSSHKFYEGFHFFETVSRNRSQNVRVFEDLDKARAWLLSGDGKAN